MIPRRACLPALVAACGLCAATALSAALCTPHELGADRRGPAAAVARSGAKAYLGLGGVVEVVDLADPAAPVRRGRVDVEGVVADLAAVGTTVVALVPGGLRFVDAADAAHPLVVGSFTFPDGWSVDSVAAAGDLALVPARGAGLRVIDFSDVTAPAEVGALAVADAADVAARGHRAYLVDRDEALLVVELANPALPHVVATVPVGLADRVALAPGGGRLATWGWYCPPHDECDSALAFFGLADPDQPVLRSVLTDADAGLVALDGARAYLDGGAPGGRIFDLTDLAHPVQIGAFPALAPAALVTASDPRFLLVADGRRGLRVHDVGDPGQVVQVALLPTPGASRGGVVLGSLAVVAHEQGLRIFDLADPARPRLVATERIDDAYFDEVVRYGEHLYVEQNSYDGFAIFDLADPLDPMPAGTFAPGRGERAPAIAGGLAFVAAGSLGVEIYDLAEPTAPALVATLPAPADGYAFDVAAGGGRAYPWTYGFDQPLRLHVWDVEPPTAPVELGGLDFAIEDGGRSVLYQRHLLVSGYNRLLSVDVADPAQPRPRGSLPLPASGDSQRGPLRYGARLVVAPGYGYGEEELVRVVAVDRPAQPQLVTTLVTPGDASGVFAGPGLFVVADGAAGITIFESCVPFADGFESGDLAAWSAHEP